MGEITAKTKGRLAMRAPLLFTLRASQGQEGFAGSKGFAGSSPGGLRGVRRASRGQALFPVHGRPYAC